MRLSFGLVSALLLALVACLSRPIAASVESGSRVLVVHDDSLEPSDYSEYFQSLRSLGHSLSFRKATQASPSLYKYGTAEFDHLLLFAPSTKTLDSDLSPQKLVQFLQGNGNILFALSPNLTEWYRDFAREFDVELEEKGSSLVDHFASIESDDADSDRHTTVAIPPSHLSLDLRGVFAGLEPKLPFLYKGIAHRLGSNPLAFPILKAPATSYSFEVPQDVSAVGRLDDPDLEVVFGSDANAALISAFQVLDTNRRNADDGPKREGSAGRALFCGSLESFSDALVRPAASLKTRQGQAVTGSSNLQVLTALTSWVTQQRGVLHVDGTSHSRNKNFEHDVRESYEELDVVDERNGGQRRLQRMYRIKDHVTFSLDLVQRTPTGWAPAPLDLDLQVSLVMLDPYITTNLTATQPKSTLQEAALRAGGADDKNALTTSPRTTRYSTTFQLPDRHGVYTFVVDWKRHGWTYISTRDTSPVRPFNHDEHPRGLHSAWPYVVGSFSTIVAFLGFVILWVCTADDERTEEEKQRKAE